MKKILVFFGCTILTLTILVLTILYFFNRSKFTIINESNCDLVSVNVFANEKKIWTGSINRRDSVNGSFYPFQDGAFHIIGFCGSVPVQKDKIGYIRMWQSFNHQITISVDDAVLYEIK